MAGAIEQVIKKGKKKMGYKRASEKSSTERSISCRGSCSRIDFARYNTIFSWMLKKKNHFIVILASTRIGEKIE